MDTNCCGACGSDVSEEGAARFNFGDTLFCAACLCLPPSTREALRRLRLHCIAEEETLRLQIKDLRHEVAVLHNRVVLLDLRLRDMQ